MKHQPRLRVLALAIPALVITPLQAGVKPNPLFSDGAVLQRGKPLPVWGMADDGHLKGFTLAGSDGKFVPAKAVIEGNTVIVTAEKIATPSAVRYNWAFITGGNLYNREGLPAAPFRSDDKNEESRAKSRTKP